MAEIVEEAIESLPGLIVAGRHLTNRPSDGSSDVLRESLKTF